MSKLNRQKFYEIVCLRQGWYFIVTGLWPLLHYPSFELVSGEKTDDWLVKTTGILISVIGITLLLNSKSKASLSFILFPGMISAGGLGFVSAFYSLNGTISKVYLGDAAVEVIIVVSWLILISRGKAIPFQQE